MSYGYPILVLAPVWAMLVNVLTHAAASRLNRKGHRLRYVFYGFCAGLVAMFLLAFANPTSDMNGRYFRGCVLTDIISYMAFAYCYFHFININVASLRIRILQGIIDSPQGLSENDALASYNSGHVIDSRIKRLISSGQLVERDGFFFLGKNRAFLVLFWLLEVLKYAVLGHGNRFLESADNRSAAQ